MSAILTSNPNAIWLRGFTELIRDAISPDEMRRLQHCADLIDRAAQETGENDTPDR